MSKIVSQHFLESQKPTPMSNIQVDFTDRHKLSHLFDFLKFADLFVSVSKIFQVVAMILSISNDDISDIP